MMDKNYYDILGVERTASQQEIKKAFRALAHIHHPDKGGDAQKFQQINRAYQTLSDPKKRSDYDRFGTDVGARAFNGFGGFEHMRYHTHFTTATHGQSFHFGKFKKIPFLAWIILMPLILLVAGVGVVFLVIIAIRALMRTYARR